VATDQNEQKAKPKVDDAADAADAPLNFETLDFNVSNEEMEAVKKLYSEQCSGMAHAAEQRDLWRMLAVARKNNMPLLPWVIDSFTRDRLKFCLAKQQTLSLQQWSSDYHVLKNLSKHKKHQEMIQAAVQTFFARYSAPFNLPVHEKTDDSIESFTLHITEATAFIQTLLDQDQVNPPFQVDVMIIPKKVVDASAQHDDDDDDDDSDFDDDEDSDDDDSDGDAKQDDPYSLIPNIKERLQKDSERVFVHKVLQNGLRPRSYHEVHRALKEKLGAGKSPANFKEEMPFRQRICFVADRRRKIEELFVFKGCEGTGDLPPQLVQEWYYQSSFTSLIPGVDAKKIGSRVSAKTSAKGYVFVMSFQVQTRDCIKAYLYTRSSMVRFLPKDVATLLPELFVATDANKEYVKQWSAKAEENMAKIKLVDPQYDRFRRATQKASK